jgi:hypothetical protein
MIKENENYKIVIMNYINSTITIVNDNEINFDELENNFDNDLESYLIEYDYINSNCHYMVTDKLKIVL